VKEVCSWRNHYELLDGISKIYSAKGLRDTKETGLKRLFSKDLDLIEDFLTDHYKSNDVLQCYKKQDFEFITNARAIIENGDAVYFSGDY